jgi:site-specific DNA-methyltransferase (adenine-specific)
MEAMADMEDNAFDLAIVDPPYGIGIGKQSLGKGGGLYPQKEKSYKEGNWDSNAPNKVFFDELSRISKNQIIWGGNYYDLPPSSCFVFWDKNNGASDFADGELAWTSFQSPLRKFKYTWSGFIQGKMGNDKEKRIHPTQKPVALYKWLLKNYANEGDKILDTHLGSGSIAIACHDMGFDLEGYEIDQEYYQAALERLRTHQSQLQIF